MVNLVHPERCEHDTIDAQGPDRSVGFSGYIMCEDCGADLTDDDRFQPDPDGDDADRDEDYWDD